MASTIKKPLNPRFQLLISIALIVGVVILTLCLFWYRATLGPFFVSLLVITLASFLLLLILRHFLLIWFSYLHQRELAYEEVLDRYPFVSIIVPAFNEAEVIQASLASLLELRYPYYEIIAVDDGSSDGTYEKMREFEGNHYGVRVQVFRKENSGKADTLNYGIRRSRAPIVVCMDSDSRLTPDALRYAVRHFHDPNVGAVAGNVKVINRHNIWTKLQALEYIEGLNIVRKAQAFFRTVNVIPGPIGIFRRSAVEASGGYSSDTFAEDFDMTVKILAEGWRINYEPKAVAFTEAPEELLDIIKQRYRWSRGILQALRKQKHLLTRSSGTVTTPMSLWYMIFEGLIWPAMNIFANLFFVWIALLYGMTKLLVLWWLLLTVLDLLVAIHAILMEKEQLSLAPYAVFYRFFYILIIDVTKVFATLEELIGLDMSWGKLARKGRI
ncbi:MAG TPA: glycosyltransferase [Thermoanaerobaculia bacterium]|jgi:poly-beta-1,6 N-acetyl-D-glucosamine synthase|nr:glycosyltransferase [Thermoanaerobaculia bacterium]